MAITAGQQYHFVFGTAAQFEALKAAGTVVATDLYFLTDTKQIYVGEDLYTGQVQFVEAFPENPSQGIIYVNATTHETKVWNGTAWNVMVPPISEVLEAATADTNLVTAKAIRDYVTGEANDLVADVAYSEADQKFTVTYGDATTSEIMLKNLITGAAYNGETGDFTFTVANGEAIVVNTPKENFLSAATFDEASHTLTLTLVDGTEVPVDLKELVDTYTVKSTATVELAMSETGEITANVKKSAADGNILVLNEDGLFVPEALIKAVGNTSTANLAVSEAGELTATVNVSAEENNVLVVKEDGLFVAGLDTSVFYTKTETDGLLEAKADKTYVDEELAKKADKQTTEDALALKANAADVYTKVEIDAMTTWKTIA